MTREEFYGRTGFTPKKYEVLNFWEMHNDYCDSPKNKDAYCRWWMQTYASTGSAPGIEVMPHNAEKGTTEWMLQESCAQLAQVEEAMRSLEYDKRPKAVSLYHKFAEMREFIKESIQSNETALKLQMESL